MSSAIRNFGGSWTEPIFDDIGGVSLDRYCYHMGALQYRHDSGGDCIQCHAEERIKTLDPAMNLNDDQRAELAVCRTALLWPHSCDQEAE